MISKEEIENIKKGLTEELGRTIEANECGLSTNDFSESIKILEGALKYIKQLETERELLNSKYIDNISDNQYIGINKIQYKEYLYLRELKQKLIEKLEERRKQNNNRYGQSIDEDDFLEMYEYSGQVQEDDYILKILKGEKE